MQMSKAKQTLAMILLFLLALAMFGQFGKNQSATTSPQGVQPGQGVQATPQELWRLETFQNKEDTGLPYDQGEFVNDATGERLWAQCLDLQKADPTPGDTFTKSGDYFSPTSGTGQSFQAFQVIQVTPTATATIAPVPETTSFAVLQGTPQPQPNSGGVPLSTALKVCGSVVVLLILVIAVLAIKNRRSS